MGVSETTMNVSYEIYVLFRFIPALPIEAITAMLAYETNDLCKKQLSSLGVILIDESLPVASIDCKASRAIFEKKS
jgi:hypothetical protein